MLTYGNMRADGTLIQRPADAGVDKEKGICSSVSLVSGKDSAQTANFELSVVKLAQFAIFTVNKYAESHVTRIQRCRNIPLRQLRRIPSY